jgi:hypothetical protein
MEAMAQEREVDLALNERQLLLRCQDQIKSTLKEGLEFRVIIALAMEALY